MFRGPAHLGVLPTPWRDCNQEFPWQTGARSRHPAAGLASKRDGIHTPGMLGTWLLLFAIAVAIWLWMDALGARERTRSGVPSVDPLSTTMTAGRSGRVASRARSWPPRPHGHG